MYIDKLTIYFSNEIKHFCGKTFVLPVLPSDMGKIEQSVSPKLPNYFIQGVRNCCSFKLIKTASLQFVMVCHTIFKFICFIYFRSVFYLCLLHKQTTLLKTWISNLVRMIHTRQTFFWIIKFSI